MNARIILLQEERKGMWNTYNWHSKESIIYYGLPKLKYKTHYRYMCNSVSDDGKNQRDTYFFKRVNAICTSYRDSLELTSDLHTVPADENWL